MRSRKCRHDDRAIKIVWRNYDGDVVDFTAAWKLSGAFSDAQILALQIATHQDEEDR